MPCISVKGGYRIRRSKGGLYPKIYTSKAACELRVSQMESHKKSFKKGGKVKKTGTYKLHKGETVLPKLKKGGIGAKQAAKVMKLFYAHKLRSKDGSIVTDVNQAQAIAMSEGRTAEKRGVAERTWKGQTRIRPKLKKTAKKKKYSAQVKKTIGWV
jgi:hypothetical protein